jgi:hypothetical protein
MADGVAIGPEWLMRTNQPERLTAGDHAFDPITDVCAKCYMTRAQWEDNRKVRRRHATGPRAPLYRP